MLTGRATMMALMSFGAPSTKVHTIATVAPVSIDATIATGALRFDMTAKTNGATTVGPHSP